MKNKDKKQKPKKRKPASVNQITAWLKKAGRSESACARIRNKNDLKKMHGEKDA